ncbi:MAG: DegT/DnrJ/EryC1/StrS family aminotransferase [bacterium]|nr:DegT/DnrJ/EryC1/StrS family aminotransferase [bacterium]
MGAEAIQMVDLRRQYERLRAEIDPAMRAVLEQSSFINGPAVKAFTAELSAYLGGAHVVTCGNGTDALQIALMALDLKAGDEIIVPAFTYIAAAEAALLLGLTPVLVDVDPRTFNLDPTQLEAALSERTKAIVVVHLFGQCADMEPILCWAKRHQLRVIEDNAQSLGATYRFSDGHVEQAGLMGDIGTTSFFPSKPLACYGDGGALLTKEAALAERARMMATHGQQVKYHHQIIGCNSRLDTLQAAVLRVKLAHLAEFTAARQVVAARYDTAFAALSALQTPWRAPYSTHVYHQYTVQVQADKREAWQAALKAQGVPSMVYYPLSLTEQVVMQGKARVVGECPVAQRLSRSVLSLPIHTEMREKEIQTIIESVKALK